MPSFAQRQRASRLHPVVAGPKIFLPPLAPKLLQRLYMLMRSYGEAGGCSASNRCRQALIAAAAVELRADDVLACVAKDPALTSMAGTQIPAANFVSLADIAGPSHLLLAAGLALGCARAKKGVVIVLAGASVMRGGAWREAALIVGERKLPAIFLFDFPPGRRKPSHAYHFPSIPVDASDAVAIHRVLHEAADHARKGHGPTLVQCLRLSTATTSGGHVAGTAAADPLALMEHCLRQFGLWSDDLLTGGV